MTSGGEPAVVLNDDAEKTAIAQSNFLSVMANRHRLHILFLLSDRECSVGELMQELRETPVAVSRHLTILRENRIISSRRCGQNVRYSFACKRALQMIKAMAEICHAQDISTSEK